VNGERFHLQTHVRVRLAHFPQTTSMR
jgi:hypothetical protein